jgi:hypothetical protein
MVGLFANDERECTRGRYLIAVDGTLEVSADLRANLASQRVMNMLMV